MPAAEPVFRFPDRVRLPLTFDVPAMVGDLARLLKTEWTEHFVRQNYSGDWSVLPLRAPAGETHPIRMIYSDPAATAFVDTPWLDRSPALRRVIECFRCPLKVVRLMRLGPGSCIHEHRDHDLMAEAGVARIHVPITSNPQVRFLLNGTLVNMLPGEAWYLRLADPHAVRNDGESERIHLVLDVCMNPWLELQLRS